MAAEPSHLWRHNFIFLSWIVVQMMLKKFQIFHMQRSTWRIFTGILLHWWRHEKSAVFPIGSSLQCMKRKIFPLHRFRDTEVQNLSFFFKMVPVPRDLWRHNYKQSMLSKKIHTMVKILCRSDLPFLRKWFLKRKPANCRWKKNK